MVTTDLITRPPSRSDDRGIHIVIAEENAITRRMIELAIAQLGWSFDSAANGEEALSAVERTADNLALILSDVQMPQMTGIELAKAMKSIPTLAGIPVVLMGWPDEEPEARAAGCDGFLSKPVSMSDLLNSLNLW
jgi:CheY-like chemotaxis protein